MLRLSIIILFLVIAATSGAMTLTLDRAADYALAHNPQLAAARLRARARRLELTQRRLNALRDYHLTRVRHDAALGRNTAQGGKASK